MGVNLLKYLVTINQSIYIMKFTSFSALLFTLLFSLSAHAESQIPNGSTMPKKIELSDFAKVSTKATFNDAVVLSDNEKNATQNQAQDIDSGLQLSDAGADASRNLEVIDGGVKLPNKMLTSPTEE